MKHTSNKFQPARLSSRQNSQRSLADSNQNHSSASKLRQSSSSQGKTEQSTGGQVKNNVIFYKSETMKATDVKVIGYGYKQETGGFGKRFFQLQTSPQLQTFSIHDQKVAEATGKIYQQHDIRQIDQVIDYTSGRQQTKCEWKFAFCLKTYQNESIRLFVRTAEEQFIWLASFYRILKVQCNDPFYQIPPSVQQTYDHDRKNPSHMHIRDETQQSTSQFSQRQQKSEQLNSQTNLVSAFDEEEQTEIKSIAAHSNSHRESSEAPKSSVRQIKHEEFEQQFYRFKNEMLPPQQQGVYSKILDTIMNAHQRNKESRREVTQELNQLRSQAENTENEIQNIRMQTQRLKIKIQQAKPMGTLELGCQDRPNDGQSTRRRRRSVIVLKISKGESLSQTLKQSEELKKLGFTYRGMTTEDFVSPKNKRIVLRERIK